MEQDLFTYLPSETILNILSRLPALTIMRCKCVCKPWLDLLTTPAFVKSHLSKSVPGLALFQGKRSSKPYTILEFVDTQNSVEQPWNTVFNFSFPHHELPLLSSANGLLFLLNNEIDNLFICNPITREYIKLPPPAEVVSSSEDITQYSSFGFGVSKVSGKYKVVRMFHDYHLNLNSWVRGPCKCEVYTLGTGSWRSVATGGGGGGPLSELGDFLNGNLHWLVYESEENNNFQRISCFDIETECFSTFSTPDSGCSHSERSLCALGDCLCLCDDNSLDDGGEIVIWLMNEYGDEKSWTKEFVIKKQSQPRDVVYYRIVGPIKIFRDGDILFATVFNDRVYCYSSKTKTIRLIVLPESFDSFGIKPSIYTPSFLPLKTFAVENVSSF